MAIDLAQLKADLNKLQESDLEGVRRLVDAALLISPEQPLADQEVVNVFQAWKANHDIFVRVVITGHPTPDTFNTQVQTSLVIASGFVKASNWLFDWFNARR